MIGLFRVGETVPLVTVPTAESFASWMADGGRIGTASGETRPTSLRRTPWVSWERMTSAPGKPPAFGPSTRRLRAIALRATALATLGAVTFGGGASGQAYPAPPTDPPAPPGADPRAPRPDIVVFVLDDILLKGLLAIAPQLGALLLFWGLLWVAGRRYQPKEAAC